MFHDYLYLARFSLSGKMYTSESDHHKGKGFDNPPWSFELNFDAFFFINLLLFPNEANSILPL